MPEVYEVKRIAAILRQAGIEGKVIQSIVYHPGGEKIIAPQEAKKIEGRRILRVVTKAKYTFFELDAGVMIWHYRFTGLPKVANLDYLGRLEAIFQLPVYIGDPFRRLTFFCQRGPTIDVLDQRCLASICLEPNCKLASDTKIYQCLAPDFSTAVMPSYDAWRQQLKKSKRSLKLELQDQYTIPSGIGNYLACEILAHAGLNPWQSAATLTLRHYERLRRGMGEVRAQCVRTIGYQWFRVFKREMCTQCGGLIIRRKQQPHRGSQMTHFCPQCQKVS